MLNEYTLKESMSTSFPNSPRLARQSPAWDRLAQHPVGAGGWGERELGEAIVTHRSSWVRRLRGDGFDLFIKTYEYPSWADRIRDFGKRTAPWTRSRALREFDALAWLRHHAFAAPEPIAVLEWRRLGFLTRSTLVTAAFDGIDAERLLPTLSPPQQAEVASHVGAFVARLHAAGFRDGNLDLRNLLVGRRGEGWIVTKIDSPRCRMLTPGARTDRGTEADWTRLLPQLQALGLAAAARRGAGLAD